MTKAPMPLKIIMAILMCTICATAVFGVITRDPLAFKIAASCVVLCAIIFVAWRIIAKSGDA